MRGDARGRGRARSRAYTPTGRAPLRTPAPSALRLPVRPPAPAGGLTPRRCPYRTVSVLEAVFEAAPDALRAETVNV